jgi:hypothetical protein
MTFDSQTSSRQSRPGSARRQPDNQPITSDVTAQTHRTMTVRVVQSDTTRIVKALVREIARFLHQAGISQGSPHCRCRPFWGTLPLLASAPQHFRSGSRPARSRSAASGEYSRVSSPATVSDALIGCSPALASPRSSTDRSLLHCQPSGTVAPAKARPRPTRLVLVDSALTVQLDGLCRFRVGCLLASGAPSTRRLQREPIPANSRWRSQLHS